MCLCSYQVGLCSYLVGGKCMEKLLHTKNTCNPWPLYKISKQGSRDNLLKRQYFAKNIPNLCTINF